MEFQEIARRSLFRVISDKMMARYLRNWQLYVIMLPSLAYIIIFKYLPMFGVVIAFKLYNPVQGVLGSPWAGLRYIEQFVNSPTFWEIFQNTLTLSLFSLVLGFPAPIILALALNEIRTGPFKRIVQTVTYAPHFISTVVMVSMIILFLSPDMGFINKIIAVLGFEQINFMGQQIFFKSIYVLSGIWQHTGYGAIIYLAALAGVNPDLYEAAKVDGASRIMKIRSIDLPSIMPVIVILLILEFGHLMKIGFEKVYLLQNPLNIASSEIIQTYVYKVGLLGANFSFSAAIGLFNSVINLILLLLVNYVSRKVSETSLW